MKRYYIITLSQWVAGFFANLASDVLSVLDLAYLLSVYHAVSSGGFHLAAIRSIVS